MSPKSLKKIVKRKIQFVKQPIENYLIKKNHRRVNQYAKFYKNHDVLKNTILYESRDGGSMTDSPYAMFTYMLEHPDFKNYEHVWSIADVDALSAVIAKYEQHPNVKFVKRGSREYMRRLATSEYLINNSTFQSFFVPKPNQTYVNTWHGTPLKSMGFDIPGDPSHSQNVVRNFLSADYLLSPNAHTTRMYTDSYKLDGLYRGKIIEEGYPRIDLTLNSDPVNVRGQLRQYGLRLDGKKKTLLYAPTWKGKRVSEVNNDLPQIIADMKELQDEIGDAYNVLVKVHPFLYKEAANDPGIAAHLVPDFVDSNELLAAVDVLVTDYSSIFFDFLVTGRPILFYTWDLDEYSEERGQYFDRAELPGPILLNVKELAAVVKTIESVQETYRDRYSAMRERFTCHDDGKVTERIVGYLFNRQPEKLNTITCAPDKKEKLLIYPGGMKDNGITSSFVNLMNNLDYNRYDVTCFTGTPRNQEALKNLAKLNENVRLLFKPGLPVYTVTEVYKNQLIQNRGERGWLGKLLFPEAAYKREHARLFGHASFDYVIDFSGYSLYWAKYLVVAEAKKKICFMHNDLLSDSERTINGRRPHRVNLRGMFTLYHRFDKLVSVSKGTMELNREKLSEYAEPDKFEYVMNSISPEKILQMAAPAQNEKNGGGGEALSVLMEDFAARAVARCERVRVALTDEQSEVPYNLHDEEIFVSKKAEYQGKAYFKCSRNDQMVGWIEARAVTLLPDRLIYEKDTDKLAKVASTCERMIYTKPDNIKGTEKVSESGDYKDVIVNVDKEAKTEHGLYCRISVRGTCIGWIDQDALHVFNRCTIGEGTSVGQKLKIRALRMLIALKYGRKKRHFVKRIENRTLKTVDMEENRYANVSNPDTFAVWTKAYPNEKAKKIVAAAEFAGEMIRLHTMHETKDGNYYAFSVDGERMGWIHEDAIDIVKEPTIIKERAVARIAQICLKENDDVWDRPFGLTDAEKTVKNAKFLDGSIVHVDKEATTPAGTSSHVVKNGSPLGWLHNRSLVVRDLLGIEVDGRFIPEPSRENVNFVNVGRLSPEKGQDNLIRAFARFHRRHANSKLYILGNGPLKPDLQALAKELDVDDAVYLLGQLENPFAFMRKCDCFVLSSHYEGQPMVLLEAMTLGMNIVATDIVANRTVLDDGSYGLLVKDSVDGLVKGMTQVAERNVPMKKFDYETYNLTAMATFYEKLQSS